MTPELAEAIEQLYRVFARYPANPAMDGSPMYHDLAQWNRALIAKPLRELSAEDLRIYHFKALTTWGSVADFKHFLPRIFELLTTLPDDFEEWVALDKLNHGAYESWSAPEIAAVRQFLLAFWRWLLCGEFERINAFFENYFPAIAHVYPDFDKLLQLWADADCQLASQRLADFVCRNTKQLLKKRIFPGSDKSELLGKQFFAWLHSPAALRMLQAAKATPENPYLNLELEPVIKQLEQD